MHIINNNKMFERSAVRFVHRESFEHDFKEHGLHYAVVNSKGYRIYLKVALKNRLLRLAREK